MVGIFFVCMKLFIFAKNFSNAINHPIGGTSAPYKA